MKNTCKMKSYFNFRFAMFAAVLIIAIHGLNYTDLEATKVACPKFDSCAGRSNSSFQVRNCECDATCVIHNDCCIDSKNSSVKRINSDRFTCMPKKKGYIHGVYAIRKCKKNWQGPREVKNKCEVLNDLSDPLMSTPATDKRQGFTYRSRYCAECNTAVQDKLTFWDINVNCNTPLGKKINYTSDDLIYRANLHEWGFTKDNVYYNCDISFQQPKSLRRNFRDCMVNLISTCPSTWHRKKVKRLCKAYMAMVAYEDNFYRNPHCALCNGVSIDKSKCTGILGARITPLLGTLFDANRSDGDIVGVKIPKKPSCPVGQNYDPFFKKCRELSCGLPGFKMVDGNCVKT